MREHRNVNVDRIKVEFWVEIGMFKQALCKGFMYPLPECFIGINTMFDRGTLTLPSTIKSKPVE